MAQRPRGYGLTADIQKRIEGKFDPQLTQEAIDWIATVTGTKFDGSSSDPNDLQDWLKDGRILCRLINEIQPNAVKKINDSKMAFKMMENIGNFLDACEKYGCAKNDLFQTVDLYEGQNIPSVVNGIHALGRKAQAKGFNGPSLGPKEASENKRDFTDEQLKQGQSVIGLQMGSNKGASQSGMTAYGKSRAIID